MGRTLLRHTYEILAMKGEIYSWEGRNFLIRNHQIPYHHDKQPHPLAYPKLTHFANTKDLPLNYNVMTEVYLKEGTEKLREGEKKRHTGEGSVAWLGFTNLALLDAGVDGFEEVCAVLVAFGQLSEFFAQELAFVVAHHPFEGWVDILHTESAYRSGHRENMLGYHGPWVSALSCGC